MSQNVSSEHAHPHDKVHSCGCDSACEPSSTQPALRGGVHPGDRRRVFHIANMDCASEESDIRHALDGLPGVRALSFDLGARRLGIDADPPALEAALKAIQRAGFKPVEIPATEEGAPPDSGLAAFWPTWGKLVAALILALLAEVLAFLASGSQLLDIAGMALAALAIYFAGFSVYGKGLSALKQGRLNINALMTVAVTGAFLIGEWPEAAMVMALYAIAEAIEARAVDRARNAIKSLMDLAPDQATVEQDDKTWVQVPVKLVQVGARVRVRPGERVPLDAKVIEGRSAIDQSPVTGESLPVEKAPGDEVYAGTINQAAELLVEVLQPADNSTLARIIYAVEQAQQSRAPTQRFVDEFARFYTPLIFAVAVAVAVLGPPIMGWDWPQALYKALVLLVIACPCALVISTPVTVVSGLAAAARRGILIKGGVHLEEARKVRVVALDKTGTITQGKPVLVAAETPSGGEVSQEVLVIAKSLASRSDHPVSLAINAGLQASIADVLQFQAVAGRGTAGAIDERPFVLGNHRWIEERGQCSPEIESRLKIHEMAGRTVTLLASPTAVLAIFAVADTIKPSSIQAVSLLRRMGVESVMLTGDNIATARTIAAQAGIQDVRGNLLPEDKLAAISALQKSVGAVAMVGDGINDAPALARANIGFAMGGAGTHTAMEAADVVVMNDDVRRVAETIDLSRRAHAILWQNITLALSIKFVFLLLAVFDDATMWMAVFADMGASLLVVFNGLRLLQFTSEPEALPPESTQPVTT